MRAKSWLVYRFEWSLPGRFGRVATVPNLVSVIRIALIPVFVWLLLNRDSPWQAAWLFGFISATDWVDGFLARKLNQVSKVGEFLDPVADRLAVVAALIAGWGSGYLPPWFAAAVLAREAAVAVGALWVGVRGKTKLDVRRLGKLATLLVYVGVALLIGGRGGDIEWVEWLGWIAGIPGLILYYVVGLQYLADARAAVARGGDPTVSSA